MVMLKKLVIPFICLTLLGCNSNSVPTLISREENVTWSINEDNSNLIVYYNIVDYEHYTYIEYSDYSVVYKERYAQPIYNYLYLYSNGYARLVVYITNLTK